MAYLEFLQRLADRLDFEVFVEFADLRIQPGQDRTQQAFHFEPARSRGTPGGSGRDVFVLEREKNLLEFSPAIKVVDQPSEVTVKGRHRDRNKPERVEGTVPISKLDDELHVPDG